MILISVADDKSTIIRLVLCLIICHIIVVICINVQAPVSAILTRVNISSYSCNNLISIW